MDKEKLLDFIQKYNIVPQKYYIFEEGKLKVKYTLMNSSYECERIMEQVQKEFDVDFYTFAYEAFCLLNIKYSQENEFFID